MYRILHAPVFSIVAHFKAVTYRVRLNDFVNLNSFVFYEVLLKISKSFQPYYNSGEEGKKERKKKKIGAEPIIFL